MLPDRGTKIEAGTRILKMGPKKMGREPRPRQMRCSCWVRGTVRRDYPPNSTQAIWMAMVAMRMMMKRGLLKKFSKTLSSEDLSLRALISLKTCMRTKVLKKMQ